MKAIMDLPGDVDRDLDGFDLAGFVQANNPDTAELWEDCGSIWEIDEVCALN